jgi:matrixin/carboxypeptidase family protein
MKPRVLPPMMAALLLLALRTAGPAAAFALTQVQSPTTGNWYPAHWSFDTEQIHFVVNDTPLELLPNLTSDSNPLEAIAAAMHAWAFAPVSMTVDGQTAQTDGGMDGANLITLADTGTNRDLVGDDNTWARTLRWYGRRPLAQPYWPIQEADVVVSPIASFAVDGSQDRIDLQSVLTHELGHALGLSHSPIVSATMFAYTIKGETHERILSPDDVAGVRSLYGVPDEAGVGTITGKVLSADEPVLGAHVVATDATGIVQVGALTDQNGRYTLTALPAGEYHVYAEPLDGPLVPEKIGSYYDDALTDFRTTFAGGFSHSVQVTAGRSTRLDPIEVDARSPGLNVEYLSSSPNGRSFSNSYQAPVEISVGESFYLVIVGEELDSATSFSISGSDMTVDTSRIRRGTTTANHPYVILPISVRSDALPGARNVYVATADETAAFTGGIQVIAP